MFSLSYIFAQAEARGASDIHLSSGNVPIIRVQGGIIRLEAMEAPTEQDMESAFREILKNNATCMETFVRTHETDFSYLHTSGQAYRTNGYVRMGKLALAFRRIETMVKSLTELGIPDTISRVLTAKQGLFLVTGPTGSGKSTTMNAIIEHINVHRKDHIITIEDPIEFIFTDKNSFFSQRELGRDTTSFANAIRAAMREDPNVIVIGEMRDSETVEAALALAETGHLVLSTLHTSGSVQSLNRITQFFVPDVQNQVSMRLSDSLIGILSQRLIPRVDKEERIAIRELMFTNSAIRNILKTGDYSQIKSAIELGTADGMITMKAYADMLREKGYIRAEDYLGYFVNE
jgi:twitching motility protein PilT